MKTINLMQASFLLLLFNSIGVYGDEDTPLLVDDLKEPEDPGEDTPDPPPAAPEPESTGPVEIITGTADCSCGRPHLNARIVGGSLAKINELPWTVAIVNKVVGKVFCGGTLICDRYVATASHCVRYIDGPEALMVYLFEEDFEVEDENAQPTLKIDVEAIIVHPDYDHRKLNNDITLLKLAAPVSISENDPESMTPACLPANNDVSFGGVEATVAGWGATKYGLNVVSKLRRLEVPVIPFDVCKAETKYKKVLTENMMCAGYLEGMMDSCSGDSGGPLVTQQGGKFVLIGVVSFGYDCAQPRAPGQSVFFRRGLSSAILLLGFYTLKVLK